MSRETKRERQARVRGQRERAFRHEHYTISQFGQQFLLDCECGASMGILHRTRDLALTWWEWHRSQMPQPGASPPHDQSE